MEEGTPHHSVLSARDAVRGAMPNGPNGPRIARIGQRLCLGGAALGALGLLGRVTDTAFLVTVVPGQPPMMPNTALGLLLIGSAGALRRPRDPGRAREALSLLAALVVLFIGAGTLVEYLLAVDLHIDQILFSVQGGPHPGRPSPPTSLALLLLAVGLFVFDARPAARARPSEWLFLSAGTAAFVGLTGFLFGAGQLYRLARAPVIGVAVPTAISLLLTSVGLLLERPTAGVMGVATSRGSGGIMLRRLILPAVLIPLLLGLAVVRLSLALGIGNDLPLVVAILTTVIVPAALFLITITAAPLNRTEQALRFSEAKSSGILSISADALISVDEDHRITMFNEGAEKIFGYSKAEAIGASLDTLIPDRFRLAHRRHVERFEQGDEVARRMGQRTTTVFGLRKNGNEFPADAAISRLEVSGKKILTVALRDITEEKRIENEQKFLAEAGQLLATSLDYEQTVSHLAELAVRNIADLCIVEIVEAERGTRQRKVVSRDPSNGSLCEALMRPPPGGEHSPIFASVVDSGTPVLLTEVTPEAMASWATGEEHLQALRSVAPRSALVVPLMAHGKPLGVVALISATRGYGEADLHLAEELGRRAALSFENARLYRAAERAIRARDEVLGIVAHDLRNPLNAILLQTAILKRSSEPEDLSRSSLEAIARSASRMNRLIQDLLDVTRMEAGRLSVEQGRVPAQRIVSDAVDSQSALASSASVELRSEVERSVPEVWADRDRLLQIFENLVSNALKVTEPGGRITVGASGRDGHVLFRVSDTGAGIDPQDVPHLFDRFWQAHNAKRQGAGLGLPIVKGIVEAHGGRVWVESTPGRGSTFFFTIPTATDATEHRREPG